MSATPLLDTEPLLSVRDGKWKLWDSETGMPVVSRCRRIQSRSRTVVAELLTSRNSDTP